MPTRRTPKAGELDPESVTIHFPPEVRRAFSDLAAAVRSDPYFDGNMRIFLEDWATNKKTTVHELLTTLPVMGACVFDHIQRFSDARAKEAWFDIGINLSEHGFALQQARLRNR